MPARGIYLIGFSGTGKSTIARAVAAELGWPACDLDDLIVERSGTTIPALFEREGEQGFRNREAEALGAASGSPPFVIATGGGAVLRVENRRLMASRGWVIALEGRPEVLDDRLRRQSDPDATRPLLHAEDSLERIRALKQARQPVYALADWTVHTDRLTPGQVAAEVVRAVRLLETTQDPRAAFDAPAPAAPAPSTQPAAVRLAKRIEARGRPVGGGRVPLVCAPLVAADREALLREAAAVAAKRPDVVEWRADFFEGAARTDDVLEVARAIAAAAGGAPLLFTLRSPAEGGRPTGMTPEQVVALYEAVSAGGDVDLVDFELGNGPGSVRRVREAARRADVRLILSRHDFDRTPPAEELGRSFREAERQGADVAKIAVMPRSRADVLTLLSAVHEADEELRIPIVGVSMGPLGALTRVCGWMFGSALTFAVGERSSAPGQLAIDDLRSAVEALRRALGAAS